MSQSHCKATLLAAAAARVPVETEFKQHVEEKKRKLARGAYQSLSLPLAVSGSPPESLFPFSLPPFTKGLSFVEYPHLSCLK